MYCVYLTTYGGNLMPKYYIGSSSVTKVENGYRGSVASKEFREVWNLELKKNPHLFQTDIISKHETRHDATQAELEYQILNNALESNEYINKSYAIPNGFFGMDVSGEKNPMYGKSRKGEKHKGGENISDALKSSYSSGRLDHMKEQSSLRMTQNNPFHDSEIVEKVKKKWKETGRGVGDKNGMYGKPNPMKGKALYNNGKITKAFHVGEQPDGWNIGRHQKSIT
jgi:hypothetical protein